MTLSVPWGLTCFTLPGHLHVRPVRMEGDGCGWRMMHDEYWEGRCRDAYPIACASPSNRLAAVRCSFARSTHDRTSSM